MKIAVIGVGHVGLVTAACLAEWGHAVAAMDDDAARVTALQVGEVPFFEPGLDDLVARHSQDGRLWFTGDLSAAMADAEVVFVCVGTPSLPGGGPNLSFVEAVGRKVAQFATNDVVLVEKSTVPVSTGERLAQVIAREQEAANSNARITVASNPEFLREGSAVQDTLHPDRIVLGVPDPAAADVLRAVYERVVAEDDVPVIVTDVPTAELIKHSSNAFLATKISFINAVARICDLTGADVGTVAYGMGLDARIGPAFLAAGLGYGGSCFPKDVDAFAHLAAQLGVEFGLLDEVRRINEGQRDLVLDKLRGELWHLQDKHIALLGASFKPGTDDLREAPSLHLARRLLADDANVRVYDPVATAGFAKLLPEVTTFDDPIGACEGAHAAVLVTEWPQIVELDPNDIAAALAYPILIDGRNALDPEACRAAGLHYHGIGRGSRA